MSRVAGKVALVTGGAMGIGRACAELLSAEGASLVITDREVAEGQGVVDCLAALGRRALFVEHDVSREDRWQHAINVCVSTYGRLDILVNNAGIGSFGDVEHTTIEDWHAQLSVNLDGVFLGIKHAIPAMRIGGAGSIINLSSIEGLVGDPALAAYNASKGAVRLLSKSAALYCAKARTNIRVNSVHPGYIWTHMVRAGVESSGHADEMRRDLEARHPIGRLGRPNDVAYGVLYLASDESAFVTGSELVIDGGYTAQ
jgi:NAD(P)-dependent dehydrogenase (short-subunit alcohol dehydrogenase family)